MSTKGKNINLFLLDGVPKGRKKCTIANWIGVAYQIPRTELNKCNKRDDLNQSGVYFLFGESEKTSEKMVYVGQASARKNGSGILQRLQEHHGDVTKEFWTEAVVFVTSNDTLGKTEISYLENRFYSMATNAMRYIVTNATEPAQGNVTEEKKSELEEFVEYAKLTLGVLGHMVLDPLDPHKRNDVTHSAATEENYTTLYIRTKYITDKVTNTEKIVDAQAIRTTEGYIVLSGSILKSRIENSCPNNAKNARKNYADYIDSNYVLTKDVLFESPSGAASFVLGRSVNGLITWVNEKGITLKEIAEQENKCKNQA